MQWNHGGLTATALLSVACTSTSVPKVELATKVVGCYEMNTGPWLIDSVSLDGQWTSQAPSRFRLTDSVGQMGGYRASRLPARGADTFNHWDQVGTGEEIFAGGVGVSGLSLKMKPTADGLEGTVVISTDVIESGKPSEVSRKASAKRIQCP